MYSRIELAANLMYGGIGKNIKEINKIIDKSIESGFYEDEKVLIMASKKKQSAYYELYEFDLEWKNR